MKTAKILVKINKGHAVPKDNVTPAEVALLVAEHHTNVGDNPVTILEEHDGVEVTDMQEKRRLSFIYGAKKVTALFPGGKPNFPADFKEAAEIGLTAVSGGEGFMNGTPPGGQQSEPEPAKLGDE